MIIMADIKEQAEKKLKSRMTKIRKCNREPDEKEKFSQKIGTTFRIEFHNKNPEKLLDEISVITNPDGKVLFAEYTYIIPETFGLWKNEAGKLRVVTDENYTVWVQGQTKKGKFHEFIFYADPKFNGTIINPINGVYYSKGNILT